MLNDFNFKFLCISNYIYCYNKFYSIPFELVGRIVGSYRNQLKLNYVDIPGIQRIKLDDNMETEEIIAITSEGDAHVFSTS